MRDNLWSKAVEGCCVSWVQEDHIAKILAIMKFFIFEIVLFILSNALFKKSWPLVFGFNEF